MAVTTLGIAACTSRAPERTMQPANRLGREQSPYLLQHAHNPVDWYRAVHERFLPRAVAVLHPEGPEQAAVEALIPYVKAQKPLDGRATAYVCEHFVCALPTHDLNRLIELLQASGASAARGRGEQGGS